MLQMPFVAWTICHLVMTGAGCRWSGLRCVILFADVFIYNSCLVLSFLFTSARTLGVVLVPIKFIRLVFSLF